MDFEAKFPSSRARFPSERLLATPAVRIHPAPPFSPPVFFWDISENRALPFNRFAVVT